MNEVGKAGAEAPTFFYNVSGYWIAKPEAYACQF